MPQNTAVRSDDLRRPECMPLRSGCSRVLVPREYEISQLSELRRLFTDVLAATNPHPQTYSVGGVATHQPMCQSCEFHFVVAKNDKAELSCR